MLASSGLSHEAFLRWAHEAGFAELSALLLWRWDADGEAGEFPDSADAYYGSAQTMLYGLRARDDLDGFIQRVRANRGPGTNPALLDDDTLQLLYARIQRWLALSLPRWREQSELAALRELPFHYHVIKYDRTRAEVGYDDGSWTSISDIGSVFNGERLTRERYERVEAAHVDTVLAMCHESGIVELEPMPWRLDPRTQATIQVDAFAPHFRRVLREQDDQALWRDPKLRFYVSVGYDYPVYAVATRHARERSSSHNAEVCTPRPTARARGSASTEIVIGFRLPTTTQRIGQRGQRVEYVAFVEKRDISVRRCGRVSGALG